MSSSDLIPNMIAGSCAGMLEHLVLFPLDTIKTRMQGEHGSPYHRLTRSIVKIHSEEGVRALYRGVAPATFSAIPAHGAYFSAYEYVKASLMGTTSPSLVYFVSGGVASIAHDTVSVPFDVIKQRMQICSHTYASSHEALRRILESEGKIALIRSLPTTIMMNIPQQGVVWLCYESAKSFIGRDIEERWAADYLACGAFAGICGGFFSAPLDVVRTRMQLGRGHCGKSIAREIYERGGIRAFWKGAVPRMATLAPSVAFTLTAYEIIREFYRSILGMELPDEEPVPPVGPPPSITPPPPSLPSASASSSSSASTSSSRSSPLQPTVVSC
eukprot:Sspe_Gene.83491::Locus_54766_Transcript_1_1_Confidence_1.000_Length_1199::g.83491::m.83491/K15113/SLC25A28_37, MFRN; solute carrier family 25 (mitochondrial iron transporter), member 28/37